jgi:hypothetical protein
LKTLTEKNNRRAVTVVELETIRDLLGLPETVRIIAAIQGTNDEANGTCTLLIAGDGLPAEFEWKQGQKLQHVALKYRIVTQASAVFDGFGETKDQC